MKIFLIILLIQANAFALNETFLKMPKDQAYMNFVLKKYVKWHKEKFSFPEESELLNALIDKLDHWIVETPYRRQLTFNHYEDKNKKVGYRVRIFIHPDLRSRKEFSWKGRPENKELMFVEWDNEGQFCQILREAKETFSSWCKDNKNEKYVLAWTETLKPRTPQGWSIPFPVLGEEIIQKEIKGEVEEVYFFEVVPHPSQVPKILQNSIFLHTKEAHFPLDRLSNTKDGRIGIFYP